MARDQIPPPANPTGTEAQRLAHLENLFELCKSVGSLLPQSPHTWTFDKQNFKTDAGIVFPALLKNGTVARPADVA